MNIKNINFLRSLLIASFFICLSIGVVNAQNNKQHNYDNYLSIEIRPSFYQPLIFRQNDGKRSTKLNISIGGSAGIKFTKSINEKVSASFGLYIEEIPHSYKVKLEDSISSHFIFLIEEYGRNTVGYKDGQYRYEFRQTTYDQLSYNLEASLQILLKQVKSNLIF